MTKNISRNRFHPRSKNRERSKNPFRFFGQHLNKNGDPKRSYDNEEEAIKRAVYMTVKDKAFYKAYLCSYCNKYHIGKPLVDHFKYDN